MGKKQGCFDSFVKEDQAETVEEIRTATFEAASEYRQRKK